MVHDISEELETFSEVRLHGTDRNAESQIRDIMKRYARAVSQGDLDDIFSFYAEDVVAFDCPPPLKISGKEEYEKIWDQYFISEFIFPVTYDLQDEKVFVTDSLAFFHGLIHMQGTFKRSNQPTESWLRVTCGFKKTGDEWKIVHEHVSVPVGQDMVALMNLAPDSKQKTGGFKANEKSH